jgi:tetratricopeptide (TPR) repeat protein/tRNA A-37 threonylcarbamoyl transferase component Bud32
MATRFRLHEGRGTDPAPTSVIDDSLIRRPRVHIAPGRQIPGTRYRAIKWLGEGGMGVVYEAEHIDIGRRVAVKILRHHYSDDEDAMELFRQEARATAQIGSENILQVHDFAQLPDGRLMMAMELLQGHDLMAEMGMPIDPSRVIAIARQACKALASAHDAGLVHRDIKPENIFLVDSGERLGKVKIVDFGIAVVLSGDKTKRKLVGTPQYIAPEAISTNEIAPKLDQYALGVVIYEMLTGTIAFEAETVAAMIQAQLHEMPYPPSQVQGSVPPALDAVVMRCLSKDPKERYADMRDLEAALCEAQIQAGLVTAWDDLPLPDVAPERKQWLAENMPSPRAKPRGEEKKRTSLPLVLGVVGALLLAVGITGGVMWSKAQQTQPERTVVDELSDEARAAASRGHWVYPPSDTPDARTAYEIIKDLEKLEEDGAPDSAQQLRADFAKSLSRLGNRFWEQGTEGSRLVAQDFYMQAQLFDGSVDIPEDRRVEERQVVALSRRADARAFSDNELIEAQAVASAAIEPDTADGQRTEEVMAMVEQEAKKQESKLKAVRNAKPTKVAKRDDADLLKGKIRDPWEGEERDEPEVEEEPPVSADGGPRGPGGGPEPIVREKRDPKRARSLAQQGMKAYKSGNYSQATLLFEQALAKNPNDKVALQGMRDAYFDKGDYGRATRYGRQVVKLVPNAPNHRIRLGDAYFKVGRNSQAEKEYKKALELGDRRAKERLELVHRRLGK